MGLTGSMWVPKDMPDEAFNPPAEPDLPITADEVHALTDEEAAALQRRLDERNLQQARVNDLDNPAQVDDSEYRKVLGASMDSLERKLRGDG